jgi:hypothetical protein
MPRALKTLAEEIQLEAIKVGVQVAKSYVPVDTGRLQASIRKLSKSTYGSTVYYAGYVEEGTVYMDAQPYMAPSFEAVKRALPGIEHDAFMRSMANG